MGVTELKIVGFYVFAVLAAAMLKIVSAVYRALTTQYVGYEISNRLYFLFSDMPYGALSQQDSVESLAIITTKVNQTVKTFILPVLTISAGVFFSIGTLILLVLIMDVFVLLAILPIGLIYIIVISFTWRFLKRSSKETNEKQTKIIELTQVIFGGALELAALNMNSSLSAEFKQSNLTFRRYLALNSILGECPRHLIEGIGIALLASVGFYLVKSSSEYEPAQMVAQLGALAVALARLIPYLQQIYSGWISVAATSHTAKVVADTLANLNALDYAETNRIEQDLTGTPIRSIDAEEASYKYPNGKLACGPISFQFLPGLNVITGPSGVGKTTFLALLAGIIAPTNGQINLTDVSGNVIKCKGRYRLDTAFSGQYPFLPYNSLLSSLRWGSPENLASDGEIDSALRNVMLFDQADALAVSGDCDIGEYGSALSGGQRIRTGLVRAVIRQKKVLLLDEPTSGLDPHRASAVIDYLKSLVTPETIIVCVTHDQDLISVADRECRLEVAQ